MKVKVISNSPNAWCSNHIGQVFEVREEEDGTFTVLEDIETDPNMNFGWRYLKENQVELID